MIAGIAKNDGKRISADHENAVPRNIFLGFASIGIEGWKEETAVLDSFDLGI
jgi:hypothetical protein